MKTTSKSPLRSQNGSTAGILCDESGVLSQQLLNCGQTDADTEQVGRSFHFVQAGISGRDAQMGIVRVLVVRVSGACAGEGQAAVLAQLGHTLGAAGHDVEADEVAALGVRPVGDVAAGSQLLVEGRLDGIKAGYQTAAVLCHVGQNAFLVLEEADVTQLVHLIIADDHDREALADVLHHSFAAGQRRNACAREGDLAGRGEHEDAVLSAVLLALVQQDRSLDDLVRQVVDDVSLIPENFEVGPKD